MCSSWCSRGACLAHFCCTSSLRFVCQLWFIWPLHVGRIPEAHLSVVWYLFDLVLHGLFRVISLWYWLCLWAILDHFYLCVSPNLRGHFRASSSVFWLCFLGCFEHFYLWVSPWIPGNFRVISLSNLTVFTGLVWAYLWILFDLVLHGLFRVISLCYWLCLWVILDHFTSVVWLCFLNIFGYFCLYILPTFHGQSKCLFLYIFVYALYLENRAHALWRHSEWNITRTLAVWVHALYRSTEPPVAVLVMTGNCIFGGQTVRRRHGGNSSRILNLTTCTAPTTFYDLFYATFVVTGAGRECAGYEVGIGWDVAFPVGRGERAMQKLRCFIWLMMQLHTTWGDDYWWTFEVISCSMSLEYDIILSPQWVAISIIHYSTMAWCWVHDSHWW